MSKATKMAESGLLPLIVTDPELQKMNIVMC